VRREGLPADNNLAERSLRPLVVMRKISGGTRSAQGNRTQLGLWPACSPPGRRVAATLSRPAWSSSSTTRRRDRELFLTASHLSSVEGCGIMTETSQGGQVTERVVTSELRPEDAGAEQSLRPRTLDEYIGQERVVEYLRVCLDAAKARGEALDHILLYGPPGLGKTTLANVVANEMRVNIKTTSGPVIERPGDLAAIVSSLREGDILFVDEVHRLSRQVEEILYPAMEDYKLDIIIGKGPAARTIRLSLPHFTLIGATTRIAQLTSPLRDRFGVVQRLDFYSQEAMEAIVRRSAEILGVPTDDEGVLLIAGRSRGTPRVANRLLKRVRDFAQVRGDGTITSDVAYRALEMLEVDDLGLDLSDRRVLLSLIDKFDGGPVGLDTIAASLSEDADTIMDVYEPYLLQLGFIERTPRGRVATRRAYEHLQRPYDRESSLQNRLF
jgi:holliday junction DNA helicase RuvB